MRRAARKSQSSNGARLKLGKNALPTIRHNGMRLASVLGEHAMAIHGSKSLGGLRIRTDEGCYDLMYWSIKFGVSIDQLLEAVARVGTRVTDVQRELAVGAAVLDVPPNHDGWIVQSDRTALLVRNDKPAALSVLDD